MGDLSIIVTDVRGYHIRKSQFFAILPSVLFSAMTILLANIFKMHLLQLSYNTIKYEHDAHKPSILLGHRNTKRFS